MEHLQKAVIFKSDSTVWLNSEIKLDHRFFGFEKPDTSSKKLILFSVFTTDVEDNPFQCPLGAYYETSGLKGQLKFLAKEGRFLKIRLEQRASPGKYDFFYVEKKWMEFK